MSGGKAGRAGGNVPRVFRPDLNGVVIAGTEAQTDDLIVVNKVIVFILWTRTQCPQGFSNASVSLEFQFENINTHTHSHTHRQPSSALANPSYLPPFLCHHFLQHHEAPPTSSQLQTDNQHKLLTNRIITLNYKGELQHTPTHSYFNNTSYFCPFLFNHLFSATCLSIRSHTRTHTHTHTHASPPPPI